jgi:hypothetical protein
LENNAMNRTFHAAVCVGVLVSAASTALAADVGVSIAISQPGVYGRVDIGRFPQPQLVVTQPVIVAPSPLIVRPAPVYMWVPVEQRRSWPRHCRRYNACGVPVYFVQDRWYRDQLRRGPPPHARGHGHGEGKGKGKGKGPDQD